MHEYRLNRLFHPESGRALDVAIDHGIFGEHSVLAGIEDIASAVGTVVAAHPDAIQLTPGQARHLQSIPDRGKPALVLRTDIANVYGQPLDEHLFSAHFPDAVEQALRLDAVCIVANLIQLPDRPEIREACIRTIQALKPQAERYGMPLMIEPLVMQDNAHGSYMVDGDTQKVVALVRQAVELGADLIKADPTSRLEDYHLVVEAASGLPLLVRGGGRVDDRELLERTCAVLEQGARGIVYGRNIIQHASPAGITRALLAVLHEGASVDDSLALIEAAAA
jgi:DhnA family fructose-bisphosphate aldolase class Ia